MTGPEQRFDRPVIILGCNRSGTTLLFKNLSQHPDVWSLYVESRDQYYRQYPVDDAAGDRLEVPPRPAAAEAIQADFFGAVANRERLRDSALFGWLPGQLLRPPVSQVFKRPPLRLVEKTPANSLRVPFLKALFPDARFIFLIRRGEDVVSSLMEGWKNWTRKKHGDGPWQFSRWHYLVPPGWQDYRTRPLEEICAFQWVESNRIAWEDLNRTCPGEFLSLRHEDVMDDPKTNYRRILDFAELPASRHLDRILARIKTRVFTTGGSAPRENKWRDLHGPEIERIQPLLRPLNDQFYG